MKWMMEKNWNWYTNVAAYACFPLGPWIVINFKYQHMEKLHSYSKAESILKCTTRA